uniref:SFRICE_017333 n=1 Tax=Spodoptera frugiperda TaxID=7108 RepID=A0A2H1W352_SPOFR
MGPTEFFVTRCQATRSRKQIITITTESKERRVNKKRIIEIKSNKSKTPIHLKRKKEVDKHKHNIRTILCNTNATPIGKYAGIGYVCSFCTQEYETPAELKTHTTSSHKEASSTFMENKLLYNYMVKLDITNLKCDICQTDIDSLEQIMYHLQTAHDKFFHLGLKSYVLPFRFDNDTTESLLSCVICNNSYNNFKVLLEHMNCHFRNYICEVCDNGFVNRKTLVCHSYRHKTGVFTCSFCQKVFNTSVKLKQHEKAVHVYMNKRNKCGYCGEKFTDYVKKNLHEVQMHGAKPLVLKCQACDKTFDNQRALTFHTKTYHLLEKSSK